jgi:uncharacterized protein YjbI with pentapeptide repeats
VEETKDLHTDQDNNDVVLHIEKNDKGEETDRWVTYGGSDKIERYEYLDPREAAILILLGYEIKKCYVPHLTVEDLLDTYKYVMDEAKKRKNTTKQPVIDIINELTSRISRLCPSWFPGSSEKYEQVLDISSSIASPLITDKEGIIYTLNNKDRLEKMEHIWATNMKKKETIIYRDIAFRECIIGELNLNKVRINGYVQLGTFDEEKHEPNARFYSQGEEIEIPEFKPNIEPTYLFNVRLESTNATLVDFYNAIVLNDTKNTPSGKCTIIDIRIKENLKLNYCKFFVRFEANKAQIENSIYARHVEFHKTADFGEMTINGNSYFDNSKFLSKEISSFINPRCDSAYFDNTNFGGEAFFQLVEFAGDAHFEEATFKGKVNFSKEIYGTEKPEQGCTFHRKTSFTEARFKENANFSDVTFKQLATFERAVFEDQAWFRCIKFSEKGVLVLRRVDFQSNVKFHGEWEETKNQKLDIEEIDFYLTRFSMVADLRRIYFKKASFRETTFLYPVMLYDSKFDSVDFDKVIAPTIWMKWDMVDPGRKEEHPVLNAHRIAKLPPPNKDRKPQEYWQDAQHQYAMLKENFRKLGQYEDEDHAHWWASECDMKNTTQVRWKVIDRDFRQLDFHSIYALVVWTLFAVVLANCVGKYCCHCLGEHAFKTRFVVSWVMFALLSAIALRRRYWRTPPQFTTPLTLRLLWEGISSFAKIMGAGAILLSPLYVLVVGWGAGWAAIAPCVLVAFFAGCRLYPRAEKLLLYRGVLGYGVRPKKILYTILAVIIVGWLLFAVADVTGAVDHRKSLSTLEWLPFGKGQPVLTGLYLSLITYATVGFGDVSATGWAAGVAMMEGLLGVALNAALIVVIFRKLIR